MGAKRKPRPRQAYELRIQLDDIEPPIWRRIAVQREIRLPKLHEAIQIAMGWENYHLHVFRLADIRLGVPDPDFSDDTLDEHEVSLTRLVAPGEEFSYLYDFGDDWSHRIVVERAAPATEFGHLPICLAGARACPPEDCGGTWGYEEFLEAIADPRHERHQEFVEWIGSFDPEKFDLEAVNRKLQAGRGGG